MMLTETVVNGVGLSEYALQLLDRVKKYIMADPRRLNMSCWGLRVSMGNAVAALEEELLTDLPECGTIACLAGTVRLLVTHPDNLPADNDESAWLDFFARSGYVAKKELGLTSEQESKLFYLSEMYGAMGNGGWPEPFASDYEKAVRAGNRKLAAEIFCDRLDHFVATGD